MLACLDVDYREDGSARVACLLFGDWAAPQESEARIRPVSVVAPYHPGAFYERELPCLLAALQPAVPGLRSVIVDGYVWLDALETPGLGAHLFQALGGQVSVIGVAKSAYRGSFHATPVYRGQAERPLFVTAQGLPVAEAAAHVREMHGDHRIPTLLKRADRLCRQSV